MNYSFFVFFATSIVSMAFAGVIAPAQTSEKRPNAPSFSDGVTVPLAAAVPAVEDEDSGTSSIREPRTSIVSGNHIDLAERNGVSPVAISVDSISTVSTIPAADSKAYKSAKEGFRTNSKQVKESATLGLSSLEIRQTRSMEVGKDGSTSVDVRLEQRQYLTLQLGFCIACVWFCQRAQEHAAWANTNGVSLGSRCHFFVCNAAGNGPCAGQQGTYEIYFEGDFVHQNVVRTVWRENFRQ